MPALGLANNEPKWLARVAGGEQGAEFLGKWRQDGLDDTFGGTTGLDGTMTAPILVLVAVVRPCSCPFFWLDLVFKGTEADHSQAERLGEHGK